MPLKFKGIQKLTLIDFPGEIACTLFLPSCNFRCGFCHNRELVLEPKKLPDLTEKKLFSFLHNREGLLDGVCVTGGEPTLFKELPAFFRKLKKLGFKTKLDTNGTNPEMVKKMLKEKLLDFVAMDIKAPLERYDALAGVEVDLEKIKESVELLMKGKVKYEFRTTVVPGLIDEKEIRAIGKWLKGSEAFYLQQFNPENTLDPGMEKLLPYSKEKMQELLKTAKPFFKKVGLRGV